MLGQNTYTRTDGAPAALLFPRFRLEAMPDEAASAREGRPIFRDVEVVEIIIPGNPHHRPVQYVSPEHKERWPREYEAFQKNISISPEGTPLEEWPILRPAQVRELKGLEVHTVEQVAQLSDTALSRIGMGARALKDRAAAFLDDAAGQALSSRLTKENDDLRSDLAGLKVQNDELRTLMTQLHGEVMAMRNAPHPIATAIPGSTDPVAVALMARPVETASSSLGNIPPRRGRPPKVDPNAEMLEGAA